MSKETKFIIMGLKSWADNTGGLHSKILFDTEKNLLLQAANVLKRNEEELSTVCKLADEMYNFLGGDSEQFIRIEAVGYRNWRHARETVKEDDYE